MNINSEFGQRATGHPSGLSWVPSPAPGVSRIMLDRIGGEVARATSIVRYAPASRFDPHTHDAGEEFLVLEGIFQDEHGDYPAGTYVRNPPGTRHAPGSAPGCTLFVKLRQFSPDDLTGVVLDTRRIRPRAAARSQGVDEAILFENEYEQVRIEMWRPGARLNADPAGGLEILCLQGGFKEGGDTFGVHSWLRLPVGAPLRAAAGPDGCRVWVKEGHLRTIRQ